MRSFHSVIVSAGVHTSQWSKYKFIVDQKSVSVKAIPSERIKSTNFAKMENISSG